MFFLHVYALSGYLVPKARRGLSDPLKLKLQIVISHCVVIETHPWVSGRAANILNQWPMSLALDLAFYVICNLFFTKENLCSCNWLFIPYYFAFLFSIWLLCLLLFKTISLLKMVLVLKTCLLFLITLNLSFVLVKILFLIRFYIIGHYKQSSMRSFTY